MAANNQVNQRMPALQQPGQYPYVSFTQTRAGNWYREDSTPGFEGQAEGHIEGSFKETNAQGAIKHLTVATAHTYVTQGSTETTELNTHTKIGGSEARQTANDIHTEHGGSRFHAVGEQTIHVSGHTEYRHAVGGITHSSNGDHVTDFNDGSQHHNIAEDEVKFVGGVKYLNVNSEYGILVGGNFDLLSKANAQISSIDFSVNAAMNMFVTAPQNVIFTTTNFFANSANVTMNNASGNTLLTVGNTITNTQINSTMIVTPCIMIGDPVQLVNSTVFTIDTLALSSNGTFGLPGQALISNGNGTYWGSANIANNAAGPNTAVQFNNSNNFFGTNGFTYDVTQNNVLIANTLSLGNSTVNSTLNSTYFSQTTNNALYIGGLIAANVVSNAMLISNLASYELKANLANDVANLTSNNSFFIGGLPAANVVSNAQLIANLANYTNTASLVSGLVGAYANLSAPIFTSNLNVGNVFVNTTAISVGNATPNTTITPYEISTPMVVTSSSMGFRNRIINGAFNIDQRGEGAAVQPLNGSGFICDRWLQVNSNTTVNTYSFQSLITTSPPPGFATYSTAKSVSAHTVETNHTSAFMQRIEGCNIVDLGMGTSWANSFTISFWLQSTLANTSFPLAFNNYGATRSYVTSYTTGAANTWQKYVITVPGDTSGTWSMAQANLGLQAVFSLGMGTTFQTPNMNVWQSNAYYSSSTLTNLISTNNASISITGVQLESGNVATPFESRSIQQEFMLCQRHCEKSYNTGVALGTLNTSVGASIYYVERDVSAAHDGILSVQFRVTKMINPTVTLYSPVTGTAGYIRNIAASTDVAGSVSQLGMNNFWWQAAADVASSTEVSLETHWLATAEL